MTEKRFKIADYPTDIEDTVTGEKYPCSSYGTHMEIICDLLNELHEENKTFREALQELKEIGDYQAMTINELHEENQSLKFQLDECQNHKLFSRRELEKENEQLKFQLQNTSDQRDEFHRGARENANRVGKLEKENEQLRHDATILIQSNQDYRKENEELKQQLTDCEKFRHTVFQQINQEMMKQ